MNKLIKTFLFFVVSIFTVAFVTGIEVKASPINVGLNTNYDVYIEHGTWVQLDLPTVDGYYYVAETKGTGVKRMSLTIDGVTITDNFDASHTNASIVFEGDGSTAHILVSFYIYYQSGTITFQARRLQSLLCGFDFSFYYGDTLNTEADLTVPYNVFDPEYQTFRFMNENRHTQSYVLQEDGRGYPWIDSDIFFYSGHGSSTCIVFPGGDYHLSITDLPSSFHTCSIAMISACECASVGSGQTESFIQALVNRGVKTAIGWTESITASDAKKFTDNFFNRLGAGYTVAQSCSYAKSKFWIWETDIRSYVIEGDEDNCMFMGNQVYSRDASYFDEDLVEEFERDRNSYQTWAVMSDDDVNYRYYKTINGYITNDYYDVQYDNNKIVSITKSDCDLTGKRINPIVYTDNCCEFDDSNIINIDRTIVYYINDNCATPISISYIEREIDGIHSLDAICYDMYTGESVDYSSII